MTGVPMGCTPPPSRPPAGHDAPPLAMLEFDIPQDAGSKAE
jgi:hypothetical protein